MPRQLLVGADARPITPDLARDTVFLAGFDPDRRATAIHDDLMVRSVAFASVSGDAEPIVLSVCDLIGLSRTHEPKGSRVVACTHTHHGPDGLGFWGRPFDGVSGLDRDYLDRVRTTVRDSQRAAIDALEPAELIAGSAAVPELVTNLRDPGLVDDELSVLRARRADGTVLATLMSYPCHPEVVASDSTEVTADYPGHLCRIVESAAGGVAVFASGALGGMLSPSTDIRTHEEAERFGRVLAAAAERALADVAVVVAEPVAFVRRDVELDLQNPIYELGMQMGLVVEAERRGDAAISEVSLTRCGPVMLAGVPGELLPKLGLRLKDAMRAAGASLPVVVGLADDELGYLLPQEDFTVPADYLDPGSQYEESFSVGPTAGERVVQALESLIAASASAAST